MLFVLRFCEQQTNEEVIQRRHRERRKTLRYELRYMRGMGKDGQRMKGKK